MATIRKRKNKYQVQVRRKDSPQVSKTFICYKDAKKWARETEIKLDQNFIQFTEDPCSLTLQSLIKKYIKEKLKPSIKTRQRISCADKKLLLPV